MDHIIYTAMSGASATASRQAVLANNLANATTNGFRAEMMSFRAVPVQGDGAKTRVFSLEATAGYVDTPGPVQRTGRNLDAMPQGNAWFAVQALDGTEAYTRAGTFEVTAQGQLLNDKGQTVLSDGGAPIDVPPDSEVTLGSDGTVSVRTGDQPAVQLARLKLVTPEAGTRLQRGADGLFRTPDGEPLQSDANARIQTGAVEGSNVNAIESMVSIIDAARSFEHQMRLLQTAESDDKSASQLLSVTA
ncbi:flagellar basal-body rod protein FlgF [Xylophilus sp.]|uniref:flagellar basal-body rod protein FlgF n=1 Tax=Xylophilus sp. TaxID=2653893 RepID=UPI0013B884EA|nr:flagellar basal-body rod protein FlgF [Xylophilus sp.]KAF1044614.1 MAG: Flagellar basal-body rod protein FlgF [Xylophilus sp.]